jgi:hypothetical protein
VFAVRRRHQRQARTTWSSAIEDAVGDGKLIVGQLPPVLHPQPELEPSLYRQLQALEARFASLEGSAPSDATKQLVVDVRSVATELESAVETDLRVRIGPPAPTDQQLDASSAVLSQRSRDLASALDRLAVAAAIGS